jgi:hypothetical protein
MPTFWIAIQIQPWRKFSASDRKSDRFVYQRPCHHDFDAIAPVLRFDASRRFSNVIGHEPAVSNYEFLKTRAA